MFIKEPCSAKIGLYAFVVPVSLCNVHWLMWDDTFHLNLIVAMKILTLNKKKHISGKVCPCLLCASRQAKQGQHFT